MFTEVCKFSHATWTCKPLSWTTASTATSKSSSASENSVHLGSNRNAALCDGAINCEKRLFFQSVNSFYFHIFLLKDFPSNLWQYLVSFLNKCSYSLKVLYCHLLTVLLHLQLASIFKKNRFSSKIYNCTLYYHDLMYQWN